MLGRALLVQLMSAIRAMYVRLLAGSKVLDQPICFLLGVFAPNSSSLLEMDVGLDLVYYGR